MLVLSRKVGERVVIGDQVTVVVTRVVGNRVTLGIEAPANVRVLRGELQSAPVEPAQTKSPTAESNDREVGARGAIEPPKRRPNNPAPLAAATAAALAMTGPDLGATI